MHNDTLTNNVNCISYWMPHPKHVHSVYKCNIVHRATQSMHTCKYEDNN